MLDNNIELRYLQHAGAILNQGHPQRHLQHKLLQISTIASLSPLAWVRG